MPFEILESNGENKPFKIKGIAMIKNKLSKNGRFYSANLVESIVENISKKIEKNGSYPLSMMADHPTAITNKTLSTIGKITKMYLDGDNAIIEAEIANTSIGKDVQELIRGKFVEGLSIRATKGKVKSRYMNGKMVKDVLEMDLRGVDLVTNPGVEGAKILDIIESADSGTYISIDEEEEIKEEKQLDYSKITLEEFKNKRPDLLESIKNEFKKIFEDEFKLDELKESASNLENLQEEFSSLKEEKEALESDLNIANKTIKEKENELNKIKEAEEKAKRDAYIVEKVGKLKFADSIKERLKDKASVLESIEEIDKMLESEVEFLEQIISESTGINIKGNGHVDNKDGIKESEDFINKVMKY